MLIINYIFNVLNINLTFITIGILTEERPCDNQLERTVVCADASSFALLRIQRRERSEGGDLHHTILQS